MEVAIIVCVGWILSVCLHEFGHAIVAYCGGDYTVKDKGYLTFNIFKYTDPGMTLFFPVLILILGGIALPGAAVYIDHTKLRSRMWESAVAAAGPISTALCGIVLALPFMLHIFPDWVPDDVWNGLAFLIELEVYAFILNSLPIPPFDGYGFIDPWLPMPARLKMREFSRYSMWVVFLLIWTVQPVNAALWAVADTLTALLHVNARMAAVGQHTFQHEAGWLVIALIAFLYLMNRQNKKQPVATPDNHLQTAKRLLGENRPVDAVNELNIAIAANENFAEAWQLRGVCFGLMNRPAEALQNFDRAVTVNPNYADAWYNRACTYAMQGRTEEALRDLAQAINLKPAEIKQHAKQDVGFRALWNNQRFQEMTADH
jgi:Zn-dependent protease